MTKEEIIEYLYENNVRGDLTIEQMADDLDRPQGEWIDDDFVGQYRCSECDYYAIDEYDYCPNCGASMKGADDDN